MSEAKMVVPSATGSPDPEVPAKAVWSKIFMRRGHSN